MGSSTTDFESLYLKTGAQGFSVANGGGHGGNQHAQSQSRLPGPEPLTAFPQKPAPFIIGNSSGRVSPTGSNLTFRSRMAHHRAIEKRSSQQERQRLAALAIQRTISRYIEERNEKEAKQKEDEDRAREKAERLKQSQKRFRQLVQSGTQVVCANTGLIRSSIIANVDPREMDATTRVLRPSTVSNETGLFDKEEEDLLSFADGLNADEFETKLENQALSAHIPTRNHRPKAFHSGDGDRQYTATHKSMDDQILFYNNNEQYDESRVDGTEHAYEEYGHVRQEDYSEDDEDEAARAQKWEEMRNRVGVPQPRPMGDAPAHGPGPRTTHCPKCGKLYNPKVLKGTHFSPSSAASGTHQANTKSNHPSSGRLAPVQENLPSFHEDGEEQDTAQTDSVDSIDGGMYPGQVEAHRDDDSDVHSPSDEGIDYCDCPPIWLSQPMVPRNQPGAYSKAQNRPMGYAGSEDFDPAIGLHSDPEHNDQDAPHLDKHIAAQALDESEALQRVHSQQSMTYVVKHTLGQGEHSHNHGTSTARYLSSAMHANMLSQTALLPSEEAYEGPRIAVNGDRAEAWQKVTQSVAKLPYQRPHPSV